MSSEPAENNPSQDPSLDLGLSGLGFGPSWVNGPTEKVSGGRGSGRDDRGGRPRFGGDRKGPPRDGGPRRDDRGPRRDGPRRDDRGPGRRPEETYFRPVVKVEFFPDDEKFERLGGAMKSSAMTYALFDVARLILDKEDRLSIIARPLEQATNPTATLSVALPDGMPFLTEGEAIQHVMTRHLGKFFDLVEVEVEPPKGSFQMVARCKQTGEILGAPTYHHYQRALRDHHARHCPDLSFDRFKAGLEMLREQERIDEWLKKMSKRVEYVPKDRQEGEPERLESLDAARGFLQAFRKDQVVKSQPYVRFAGRLLADMPAGALRDSVRFFLEEQREFPLDTANGIRGRLRKEGFHLYKKGSKGITYVCGVRRRCRDPQQTFSDSMQKILDCLDREGGQQTKDILAALAGPEASEEAKARVAQDLLFLINEGYVAKLADSRLFAQPVLSSQAQAKEEAANDEGADEAK